MRIAYIPKGKYEVGQVIDVQGKLMTLVERSWSGRNYKATPVGGRYEMVVCIVTDAKPIVEVTTETQREQWRE
jgi:hypothetical protein